MVYSYRIIPDKQLDNGNIPEMFNELHNYKTIWERKRFLYDGYFVSLQPNYIGWEIKVTASDVAFYFITTNETDDNFLRKSFPKSTIETEKADILELNTSVECIKACELELKYHYFLSLSTDKRELEPIASVLDVQKSLKEDDYVFVQYIFCPESYDWNTSCIEAYEKFKNGEMPLQFKVDKKEIIQSVARAFAKVAVGAGELVQEIILDNPSNVETYKITDSNVARILKEGPLSKATMEKAKHNAYISNIRLMAYSKKSERRDQILRCLAVGFNTVGLDNYLSIKKVELTKDYCAKIYNKEPGYSMVKTILSTDEVAKLCLLPQITLQNSYKMKTIETREVEISEVLLKGTIPIGEATKNGRLYKTYWENKYDIITLPKVVVGGMGMGKTEFTANFVVNAAKEGHGVILPDYIKGCELSEKIARYVPSDRIVILDLSDISKPFSFAYSEIKITDSMTTWEKIKNASSLAEQTAYLINALNDGIVQPLTSRMNKILNAACMVTYTTGHIKVYDVINVLQNHVIRHEYINEAVKKGIYKVTDIKISDLLSLDELSIKGKVIGTCEAKIESIMDRIDILLRNPYLEIMLMSEPNDSINFVNYMNEGKIVLIKIPEDTFKKKWIKDVIMTYLMSRIWLSVLMRSSQKQPRVTHIVTDEIHQVPTAAKIVADTITESRKFGVGYYFTCQFLGQFKSLLEGVQGAGASYMLLAGTDKKNFVLLQEESGEFVLEELLHMKEFHSFNIIKTSKGTKKFITKLPPLLDKGGRARLFSKLIKPAV